MNAKKSLGFTIVEVMIALLIGSFLMAGAITVMVNSQRSYNMQDDLARLQENARFAIDSMARDIRMAGYFGCMSDIEKVFNHINGGAGDIFNTNIGLLGSEGSEVTRRWLPTNNTTIDVAGMVAGSDGITVRYIDPDSSVEITGMTQASANIQVADGDAFSQGEIVVITDCASSDIFQINNANPSSEIFVHNTGSATVPGNAQLPGMPNCPGANAHCLSKVYEDDSMVMKLIARRYYIGTGANGRSSLFRRQVGINTAASTAVELAPGIVDMQITYGRNTAGDDAPEVYERADQVGTNINTWQSLQTVHIELVAATEKEYNVGIDNDFTLMGTPINPADNRLYRVFSTTLQIRNEL